MTTQETAPTAGRPDDRQRIDDYRWLVSRAAEPWLLRAAQSARPTVAVTAELRRELSPERTHLVLEQVELRRRARVKFAAAERMFFTAVGLEQATDQFVAAYKAARFPARHPVADLCCGIGGDLAALAARGPVTGVDRDPAVTILAAANVQAVCPGAVLDVQAVDVNCCDLRQFAAWHIDPDRRATGRRTTRVELHEPGPEVIDQLRAAQPDGAVKLAPAATLPESWEQAAELEWISRGGECRQLVCWFGCLASDVGRRRATIVADMNGAVRTLVGRGDERLPLAKELGQYLYEPDAAVLAAGLTATLAAEQELAAITPGIAYLTADHVVADPALACFAVRELLPLDKRRLRAVLRERLIGRLEIKKRGVDVDIEKLRRELRLEGDNMATLVLLPYAGRPTALLAERIVSNSYAQGLE